MSNIFNFWITRHPQLTQTVWGLLSGKGWGLAWARELASQPVQIRQAETLAPLSDWHRNVGLRLEYWRLTRPQLTETDVCHQLQYTQLKYQRVVDGHYPLMLLDLEHLSEITGIPLAQWMPQELQTFFD